MFIPERIIFEKQTQNTKIGTQIYNQFHTNPSIEFIENNKTPIKKIITQNTISETYKKGKKTLVVSKKRNSSFQTCKPSADYMLPLVSGCMGQCEYCYLHTKLGDKPFIRVYVNLDEIFQKVSSYIINEPNKKTIFEGSATSDPLCVEPYTHALEYSILFFANQTNGKFRFVTKYCDVNNLLSLNHKNKTEIRFSINTQYIYTQFEHDTSSINARILAASKIIESGYPCGFLIAPVFCYENWQTDYHNLILNLKNNLPATTKHVITFEVISHRYTPKAKSLIQEIFPQSSLPMNDDTRVYKHGQFGYGKYTYKKEDMREIKEFFQTELTTIFPACNIKYII